MKISVIIPTYCDNERLEKCLDAIEAQINDQKIEILVVDNFGDPLLEKLLKRYPHVRYLVETTPGSYAARNAALNVADGEAVAFTDSDCIPAGSWLSQIARTLETSEADIIAGCVSLFPKCPESPNSWEIADMFFGFPIEQRIRSGGGGVTANLVIRRHAFAKVGHFDASVFSGGDLDWCSKARDRNLKIIYSSDIVVMHPARQTAGEHLQKAKRVAGALAVDRQKSKVPVRIWADLVRLPLPPVRDALSIMRSQHFGIFDKLRGLGARTIFHYYLKTQVFLYLLLPARQKKRC